MRIELHGHPRVGAELRRQQEPAVDHLHARRDLRRDGQRLREDRRQARARLRARDRRRAARRDGALRRVVRPRADLSRARQHERRRRSPGRGVLAAQRAGSVRARARHDEVGRQPRVADPFRGIRRARVQDRDDAADGARRDRRRREDAGRARSCRHADPEAEHPDAAGRRLRRDRRAREAARGGREPRHSRGPRRPHACRLGAHGRARRNAAGGRRRYAPTSELSDAPPLERRLAGSSRRRARARGRRHLERHAPSAATQRESHQPHRRRISFSAATTKTSCAMPRSTCRSPPTPKRRCRH